MYATIVMFVNVLYAYKKNCGSGKTDCKIVVSKMHNLDV